MEKRYVERCGERNMERENKDREIWRATIERETWR